MSTLGHWVAADAGGAGTTLPDRGPLSLDGTLGGSASWETIAGEAAVHCPSDASVVELPSSCPQYHVNPSHSTYFFRMAFHSLAGHPSFFGRSTVSSDNIHLTYRASTTKLEVLMTNALAVSDTVSLVVDTIYVIVVVLKNEGSKAEFYLFDSAGVQVMNSEDWVSCVIPANPGESPLLGPGGGVGGLNGDIGIIAARIETTVCTPDEIAAIAADPELVGTVTPATPPTPPTRLIAHFVADDAGGSGLVLPERVVANDAFLFFEDDNNLPTWGTNDEGCAAVRTTPNTGRPHGCIAPFIPAYDVSDFTLLFCAEMGGSFAFAYSHMGMVERYDELCGTGAGNTAGSGGPWWSFGVRNAGVGGVNPTIQFRHSDGATVAGLVSDPIAQPFVQIGTTAPVGATVMSTCGIYGVRRSGNTFTFFWKAAVFRRDTGACIDPVTGAPATIPAAQALGTATSSLVSGVSTRSLPLRIGATVDSNAFGGSVNISWGVMYDQALSDARILDIMDTEFPVCGTATPPETPAVALPALCVGPLAPAACPQPEEA